MEPFGYRSRLQHLINAPKDARCCCGKLKEAVAIDRDGISYRCMPSSDKKPSQEKLRAEILSRKSRSTRPPVKLPAQFQPKFWEESDRRCAAVRAIKARYLRLREDCGGDESYQRDLLVQRVVFLSIVLETQEVRAAEGGDIELGSYIQAVNGLTGLLKTLGLDKRVRNITDLKQYLENRR